MIRTKNFHPDFDKKLLCTCEHKGCDRRSVSQSHLNRIQIAREIAGFPFNITSGGRCSHHPSEAHRTEPADHQKCMGADVFATGATRGNIVAAGLKAGCNAIGIAATFVHLGYREDISGNHITMWSY